MAALQAGKWQIGVGGTLRGKTLGLIGLGVTGTEVARLDLDNNFTGWQRDALVEWPADRHGPKRALHLRAEVPLDYFVLYSPAGFDHFCAEPVSQCTDWLNLLEQYGRDAVGGTVLQPGERLDARFTLEPEWT